MLLALNEKRQLVLADQVNKGKFICPGCSERVILKKGRIMIPHFAHIKNGSCVGRFSEGETAEHLAGKKLLRDILPDEARIEAFLPELQQRPDILWQRQAFEFQCSPISGQRFVERTQNYQNHNYRPFWILGKKLSPERHWGALQQGASFFKNGQLQIWVLDVKRACFEIFNNIDWHYQRGICFSKESYPLRWLYSSVPLPGADFSKEWLPQDLKKTIQVGLGLRQRRLLIIQEQLYLRGTHFLKLPEWCYLPSRFFIFYQFQLFNLRSLFLISDSFDYWQGAVKQLGLTWPFLQVPEEKVLRGIFQECQKLAVEKVSEVRTVT